MGIKDYIIEFRLNLNNYFRSHCVNPRLQKRLKNRDFTLLSNNCNGACILHDLNLQFRSPFVNLWLPPKDFIKYCSNIAHYNACELQFVDSKSYGAEYPVARLDDILIFFEHYASEEEARKKWNDRKARMNDKIMVLYTARDGWEYEDLVAVDQLPFPKKILVNKHYPELKSAFYISGFDKEPQVGILSKWVWYGFWGRKYYDQFDYVSFFNGEEK